MSKLSTCFLLMCLKGAMSEPTSDKGNSSSCSDCSDEKGYANESVIICYNSSSADDATMQCFPMTFSDLVDGFLDSIGIAGLVVVVLSSLLYLVLLMTAISVLLHRGCGGKGAPGPNAKLCKMYGKVMSN
ncbi:uncharacterized protein LOC116181267 isoform X1 [Photinus pyralis]|uniref:uncharacterized protein LOC116181267 isoform X1 n=1 Tax=Photinus pyralis TaxID=7054 RepID=UPI0012671AEB|nr:uncharacterized protein LOC116181267 isoform X1 [Photinus pyralis]